ncbi:hypothetical protein HELRODRAFT_191643 [Helobdella robusta]|uniref:Uncharacterized protein n=1 Tax=Helobdella robusta TaxID=6412 RepID=T1FT59_HELRO|nr:hypothetical protein HELRODRAFT_191643 [Helobdella robusta]ESO04597.1 hypothetical protein HELRODRAFT_191643 [Helobdella robusta]
MEFESLPEQVRKRVKVFDDGATIKIPLPLIGFQNMFDPGPGGVYLLANYFTLATFISTKTPSFMQKYLANTGTYDVYAVQTILIIKPHFYTVIRPYECWEELESHIDLVSFYRSTIVTSQTIRVKKTQQIVSQVLAKLITIDSTTKKSHHIPEMFCERFSKYHKKPHPTFKDIKNFIEINRNMSKEALKSLFLESDSFREVFKVDLTASETDQDWNYHLSNSVYIRICGDTLKQAISKNKTFNRTFGLHKDSMKIPRVNNSYLKECKAGDELRILCILHISNPQKVEFRIFKMANVKEDVRIVYVGEMQIDIHTSKL